MASKHLSRDSQNINHNAWYYEEPRGAEFVVYHSTLKGVECFRVPWRKLAASVKRWEKDQKAKKKGPHAHA